MGIKHLLPALRDIQADAGYETRVQLYDGSFRGSCVAVDGCVLLHRFALALGTAQAMVLPIDAPDHNPLIEAVVRAHKYLRSGGLQTISVFDGAPPPGKNKEKAKRRQKAVAALLRVRQQQNVGQDPSDSDVQSAASCFLTVEARALVVDALHAAGFSARVALTEADGQLAQLARTGAVDHVLTIDSDLIAYGCPSVLMIPAPSRRSRDTDGQPGPRPQHDTFDFTTGNIVHHYNLGVLCSCAGARAKLTAA
eukprot:SAG31_NODE_7041_length_1807_cov_1.233021_1_plen_251_part_10